MLRIFLTRVAIVNFYVTHFLPYLLHCIWWMLKNSWTLSIGIASSVFLLFFVFWVVNVTAQKQKYSRVFMWFAHRSGLGRTTYITLKSPRKKKWSWEQPTSELPYHNYPLRQISKKIKRPIRNYEIRTHDFKTVFLVIKEQERKRYPHLNLQKHF